MKKNKLESICENFIRNTMDFHDIPGLAVGVCCGAYKVEEAAGRQNGACSFTGAGGYRNYVSKDPVEADTVFHCTSVSKLFTSAGVMKLVERGQLRLDDRLKDVLPCLTIADRRWENITIGSMLSHTSGLTDVNDYGWEKHETGDDSLKQYALSDEVSGRNLLWDPSEGRFRYSSLAYDLLGLVITEVSGVPFEAFMAKEIFKPLGMDDTTFMTFERIDGKRHGDKVDTDVVLEKIDKAGMAMPHKKAKDRSLVIEDVYPYTRQHAPSSTLTSTAGDLLKWAAACMGFPDEPGSSPLDDASLDEIWQARVTVPDTGEKMGLGWFIREQGGHTLMGHEGSDDGFRTSFWICPQLQIAVVLLCNLTDAPLKKLSKKLFEELAK